MNDTYLLRELFKKVALLRKAQKAYYSYRGDPKVDPIKKAHLQEAQRREEDLDRLMILIEKERPDLAAAARAAVG